MSPLNYYVFKRKTHMDIENNTDESREKPKGYFTEILQWIEAIVIAVVIAMLIRAFVFVPVKVEGPSMQNTLYTGQQLILYKLGYRFSPPRKGDIIVLEYQQGIFKKMSFIDPTEVDFIKRVIALPGDTVDIKDGYVYVNGSRLDEPYAKGRTDKRSMSFPQRVPENSVFVLGDNRENSKDSREIGFVDFKKIRGKAVLRIWPLTDISVLH